MSVQHDLRSASKAFEGTSAAPGLVSHVCQIASAVTSIDQMLIGHLAEGDKLPDVSADLLEHFSGRLRTQAEAIRKSNSA